MCLCDFLFANKNKCSHYAAHMEQRWVDKMRNQYKRLHIKVRNCYLLFTRYYKVLHYYIPKIIEVKEQTPTVVQAKSNGSKTTIVITNGR